MEGTMSFFDVHVIVTLHRSYYILFARSQSQCIAYAERKGNWALLNFRLYRIFGHVLKPSQVIFYYFTELTNLLSLCIISIHFYIIMLENLF